MFPAADDSSTGLVRSHPLGDRFEAVPDVPAKSNARNHVTAALLADPSLRHGEQLRYLSSCQEPIVHDLSLTRAASAENHTAKPG